MIPSPASPSAVVTTETEASNWLTIDRMAMVSEAFPLGGAPSVGEDLRRPNANAGGE
jgi:hypothetical protein